MRLWEPRVELGGSLLGLSSPEECDAVKKGKKKKRPSSCWWNRRRRTLKHVGLFQGTLSSRTAQGRSVMEWPSARVSAPEKPWPGKSAWTPSRSWNVRSSSRSCTETRRSRTSRKRGSGTPSSPAHKSGGFPACRLRPPACWPLLASALQGAREGQRPGSPAL